MSGVHACAPPTSRGRRSRRSLHCAEAPPLAPPEKHPSSLASSQLAAHEGSRPNPSGRRACLVSPPVGGKLLPFFPAELAAPRQAAVRATARTRLLPGAPSSGRARAQPFCSCSRSKPSAILTYLDFGVGGVARHERAHSESLLPVTRSISRLPRDIRAGPSCCAGTAGGVPAGARAVARDLYGGGGVPHVAPRRSCYGRRGSPRRGRRRPVVIVQPWREHACLDSCFYGAGLGASWRGKTNPFLMPSVLHAAGSAF